jgi:D-alanine-D-alanine ligase
MAKQRVAVIFGGRSGEHEVSLVSAQSVMRSLDPARWEAVPIGITKDGRWMGAGETQAALAGGVKAFTTGGEHLLTAGAALADLRGCDVAFPLVHGTFGEDGTLQGFLEMAGMPYTGAGVGANTIGMDKALMKAIFVEAGIPTPLYGVIRSWEYTDVHSASAFVEERVGYPAFVKPANGGSSVGVTKVQSREDVDGALRAAFAYDDKAIVESGVMGQEVECSVLGNERPEASICGEIVPDRDFYDYESKYSSDSTSALHIPARIDAVTAERVRALAIRMYQAMGCEGYARVDFFVRNGTEVIANEVNTIPGFTSISMYPKLWEASGLGYSDLLTRIIELAFERHTRRNRG